MKQLPPQGFLMLSLAFVIGFLPFCVEAQEWHKGWTGDLSKFVMTDGLLTYPDDGQPGKADIYQQYKPSDSMKWTLEVRWESCPTSFNTFSWLLFEQTVGNSYRYRYLLEPSSDGSTLYLIRKYYRNDNDHSLHFISQESLHSFPIGSPHTDWSEMDITALYTQRAGLVVQVYAPFSGLNRSPAIKIQHDSIRGIMGLLTRYTAIHKLKHKWSLPVISTTGTPVDPLKSEKITAQKSGRVTIILNKEVDITNASVLVPGFSPTLMHGSRANELIIELGQPFIPNRKYDFTINGLLNIQGAKESLSFTIDTTIEDNPTKPGNTTIPNGIYITEIMADPPPKGPLSGMKYIELYNNTDAPIRLDHLLLIYRNSRYPLPPIPFSPHTYIILHPGDESSLTIYGNAVPMERFPALSRTFTLSLIHAQSKKVLDQVYFSPDLYGYGERHGGASVERITYDPDLWLRSNHDDGGTPGRGTSMKPYPVIHRGSIVINEIMLSPASTGEKYIELYNNGDTPIDLSALYLSYHNLPESSPNSWKLVKKPKILLSGRYCVLSPYPSALSRIHTHVDVETFVERIDFPSISPTYAEIELHGRSDDALVDAMIYRRQWLGDHASDRTKFALERIAPGADGKKKSSWRRAKEDTGGGTPGLQNSVFGIRPDDVLDDKLLLSWPETPDLTYDDMTKFMQFYPELATLDLYTLMGQPLYSGQGHQAQKMLQNLKSGTAAFPSMLMIIRITFTHPDPERIQLIYSARWAHTPSL